MPTIDHNPHERPRKSGEPRFMWWVGFVILALLWAWFFTFQIPSWVSVGIGFGTGLMVMAWAADIWGDKPYKEPPPKE
jgi:hypothetical protein